MTRQQGFRANNHETSARPSAPPDRMEGCAATRSSAGSVPGPASFGQDPVPGVLAFTVDELEVLRLLADGQSEGQIAERLGLTLAAAHIHVANLYFKVHAFAREPELQYAPAMR
jgi:DNA-binding NarL/FixJ family response regulator